MRGNENLNEDRAVRMEKKLNQEVIIRSELVQHGDGLVIVGSEVIQWGLLQYRLGHHNKVSQT